MTPDPPYPSRQGWDLEALGMERKPEFGFPWLYWSLTVRLGSYVLRLR